MAGVHQAILEMCARACTRVQLAENAARLTAQLADQQCKCSQLDRNLAWKEEHERSKQRTLEDEAEVAKVLTHEAECAQRAELEALRKQVEQASQDLLEEDSRTAVLKHRDEAEAAKVLTHEAECAQRAELEALRKQVEQASQDLLEEDSRTAVLKYRDEAEAAKVLTHEAECAQRAELEALRKQVEQASQDLLEEDSRTAVLKHRDEAEAAKVLTHEAECAQRAELEALRKQVEQASQDLLEEDSRTAVLKHRIEDYMQEKNEMIEDLEACQTKCEGRMGGLVKDLKCKRDKLIQLEDEVMQCLCKEPVEKAVEVKRTPSLAAMCKCSPSDTIEWVGECCADMKKPAVSRDSKHSMRWQEHDLEMKAQKLANELAEKMFREKAKELAKLAQEELKTSRPPCECDLNDKAQYSAIYQCLVPPYSNSNFNGMKNGTLAGAPTQAQRKNNPIPQMAQIRSPKKDSHVAALSKNPTDKFGRKDLDNRRPVSILKNKSNTSKLATPRRPINNTGKNLKSYTSKANPHVEAVNGPNKFFREPHQYAVNMCLYDNKTEPSPNKPPKNLNMESELTYSHESVPLNQPKLLAINSNDHLHHCDDNVKTIKSNTNRPLHIMPSVKSAPVKRDFDTTSIENFHKIKNKLILDCTGIVTSINKNENMETKLPVTSIVERSAVARQSGEKCIQCLGATLANTIPERSLVKNENNVINCEQTNTSNLGTLNNQKLTKEIGDVAKFPSGNKCQNYIQFLGVALDKAKLNILLKQNVKKTRNHRSKRNHRGMFLEDKRGNNHNKSDEKLVKFGTNRDIRKTKYAINRIKALNVLHVHNQCVYPRKQIKTLHQDKSVEIQYSGNNVFNLDEPCICCPLTKSDNSNDLEVNAFQLLEEHLKSKLDEFKRSACKSSCIPMADQKTMLGDTILKVKKLILESANNLSCKCGRNNRHSGGSWNRAYGLLHEYLKTKIEHVKCICSSVEYRRDENLVKRVLSEISCLIENDLQRLKNVCKCNDTSLDTTSKRDSHISHESQYNAIDLKKQDIISNAIDQRNVPISVIESNLVHYTNGSIPHNKSAQVLLRHSVETKSCDALKIYSGYSEVQTLDLTELVIDNYIKSECDDFKPSSNQQDNDDYDFHPDRLNNEHTKEMTPFQKRDITLLPIVMSSSNMIIKNDSKANVVSNDQFGDDKNIHVVNNDNKIDEPFLANIGCTIDCSCDHNLGCVCTKSRVPLNTEWLRTNDIFKTFTQKQSVVENVSYILKNFPNKISLEVNSIEQHSENIHVIDKMQINNINQKESNDNINIYYGQYKPEVYVVDDKYKTVMTQESKTEVCEFGVNASEEEHIYLKQSNPMIDVVHDTVNTFTDDCSLQNGSRPKSKHHSILKRKLFKDAPMSFSNSDTALISDVVSQKSESLSTDCDCAMVPICHVKMLVENIGNKLVKAEWEENVHTSLMNPEPGTECFFGDFSDSRIFAFARGWGGSTL
ncbi:uncharacterized protein LOC125241723 [Leguminivora glycinivorella]|uniref:uncharacterized protein LOC125241723 n=1 Tax=Leguminivora glycinivorella TaxID=1035111 RepID=UPI00200E764B|nr:uncharacterized protein LOC125241723 [Leguminivora glycinivorella]